MLRQYLTTNKISHEIRIDHSALPADLSDTELIELQESLPPSTRKTKPKATNYDELVALALADLHELARKEKIEGADAFPELREAVERHRRTLEEAASKAQPGVETGKTQEPAAPVESGKGKPLRGRP